MRPSRRTQPYRQGQQHPGPVLSAMLKGAPQHLANPQDLQRAQTAKLAEILRRMQRG